MNINTLNPIYESPISEEIAIVSESMIANSVVLGELQYENEYEF